MDTCAKALVVVEKMINDGEYDDFLNKRYSKWQESNAIESDQSFESIHEEVIKNNINPKPVSGRQEFLENLINKYLN